MSVLEAKGLRYAYPTGFAVGPLDVAVDGGVVHLQGANGTGKTTLLRCLCGGLRQSTGTLRIAGRDPRDEPEARRDVAFVPAEPELPDFLTVDEAWQQLAALRRVPDWDGSALRERFGLPGSLRLGQCSAGQRRMAELVAGAAGAPRVLLLDEPFANLDESRRGGLAELLTDWAATRIVVVTSHRPLPVTVHETVTLRPGA